MARTTICGFLALIDIRGRIGSVGIFESVCMRGLNRVFSILDGCDSRGKTSGAAGVSLYCPNGRRGDILAVKGSVLHQINNWRRRGGPRLRISICLRRAEINVDVCQYLTSPAHSLRKDDTSNPIPSLLFTHRAQKRRA